MTGLQKYIPFPNPFDARPPEFRNKQLDLSDRAVIEFFQRISNQCRYDTAVRLPAAAQEKERE